MTIVMIVFGFLFIAAGGILMAIYNHKPTTPLYVVTVNLLGWVVFIVGLILQFG
jgi:hypothetical protein